MMGTPADLEDFAIGFSLTEGIVGSIGEIERIEVVNEGRGLAVQVTLLEHKDGALRTRRRHMAGPVGGGLCGIEYIEQAMLPVRSVATSALALTDDDVVEAG